MKPEGILTSRRARLSELAESEGLPLLSRSRTCNSSLAQELGKWAESRDKGRSNSPLRREEAGGV